MGPPCGVGPIADASGSNPGRVRLNRSGNRLLNAAIHRIAFTQIGPGLPRLTGSAKCTRRAAGRRAPPSPKHPCW